MTDTAATVPDEADIVIPDGVLNIAVNAATPIYINAEGDDEDCAGAVVLAALIALAEAGWVLASGSASPVESSRVAAVPDEAVEVAAQALFAAPDEVISWYDGDPAISHMSAVKVARYVLAAVVEAGWEFVRGPVDTEWSNTYTDTGERWPRHDEAAARDCAADSYPAVAAECRQVTAWRPAAEPTADGGA